MKAGPKATPPATRLPALRARTPSQRVEEFARRHLTHVKGELAGRPLRFAPWQRAAILEPAFNTLGADGRRQYRTVYLTCPRKQGKTTIGAALALYLLYADGEPGAEIVSAAASREQAAICFNIARSMVEASPALRDMTQVFQRELVVPSTGSRYRVIPADAPTAHGFNLSGCIMDELHAWPDRRLYEALVTATGARRQPLTVILTTAGTDEHSIAAEVHRYAGQVLDGVFEDPTLLSVIYAAAADADPWDVAVWRACNPALADGFRSLEELQSAARHAQAVPGREPAFRQLYLNQWGTAAAARWLPLADWDACAELGPPADLTPRADLVPAPILGPGSAEPDGSDEEPLGRDPTGGAAMSVSPPTLRQTQMFAGRRAVLGLDLSTTQDLSALVILLPDGDGGFDVRAEFWCPADQLEQRSRRDRVPYVQWAEAGFLQPTPGNIVDTEYIRVRLHALMAELDVAELAVDPWNARGFIASLQADGVPAIEVAQTMANLTTASKELEKLVLGRRLRHDGHPILRWCISNAVADTDSNGNLKPSKKRSHERIDGVSALVTALARALVLPGSIYDTMAPAAMLVDL